MKITPQLSPNFDYRTAGDPIDLVVLHATVGSLQSSLDWLTSRASGVSSHYLIGKDGQIHRLVAEQRLARHAGVSFWRGRTPLNRYSIGIELENLTGKQGFVGQDPYPEAQFDALVWLLGDICSRRSIPLDRQHIVTHAQIAPRRKSDPAGFDMASLMQHLGGASASAQSDVWFVVPSRVNIRQGPGTDFPIAGQAHRGQQLHIDAIVRGEKLGASDLWAHMARRPPEQWDVGFVKLELLRQGN